MAIIMYHGRECPHCHVMMPLVDKLIEQTGIKITKKEVWHSEKNADEMRSHKKEIAPACGGDLGTPAFFSPKTKKVLCGECSYSELVEWVMKNK